VLLPVCASTMCEAEIVKGHPRLVELIRLFRERHPEVVAHVAPTADGYIGYAERRLLSPVSRSASRAYSATSSTRKSSPVLTAAGHSRATTRITRSSSTSAVRPTTSRTCPPSRTREC